MYSLFYDFLKGIIFLKSLEKGNPETRVILDIRNLYWVFWNSRSFSALDNSLQWHPPSKKIVIFPCYRAGTISNDYLQPLLWMAVLQPLGCPCQPLMQIIVRLYSCWWQVSRGQQGDNRNGTSCITVTEMRLQQPIVFTLLKLLQSIAVKM